MSPVLEYILILCRFSMWTIQHLEIRKGMERLLYKKKTNCSKKNYHECEVAHCTYEWLLHYTEWICWWQISCSHFLMCLCQSVLFCFDTTAKSFRNLEKITSKKKGNEEKKIVKYLMKCMQRWKKSEWS